MQEKGWLQGWGRAHAASLGFYLYALLLAPPLARVLKTALAGAEPVLWPGVLLLAVQFVEPVGLNWKMKFLRRRNVEEGFEPEGPMLGIFSAVGIAHVIVSVFLGMLALDCWGVIGAGSEESSGWWGAVIIALVVKEIVALGASGGSDVSREAPGHWKEWLADVLMGTYGCVAYTAWWGALLDFGEMAEGAFWGRVALAPVLGAIFLFFYLPMRLSFLVEEYHLKPRAGRKARLACEGALGLGLGMYPLFF
jgi:hypothetical protein